MLPYRIQLLCLVWMTVATGAAGQCLSGDCSTGKGTLRFPDGSSYTGQFVERQPSGTGVFVSVNKDTVRGMFSPNDYWTYFSYDVDRKPIIHQYTGVSNSGYAHFSDDEQEVTLTAYNSFHEEKSGGWVSSGNNRPVSYESVSDIGAIKTFDLKYHTFSQHLNNSSNKFDQCAWFREQLWGASYLKYRKTPAAVYRTEAEVAAYWAMLVAQLPPVKKVEQLIRFVRKLEDGKLVFASFSDYNYKVKIKNHAPIKLWYLRHRGDTVLKYMGTLEGTQYPTSAVIVSPNGKYAFTSYNLFEVSTGKVIASVKDSPAKDASFSNNSSQRPWDDNNVCTAKLTRNGDSLLFIPGSVSEEYRGQIHVYEFKPKRLSAIVPIPPNISSVNNPRDYFGAPIPPSLDDFTADGKRALYRTTNMVLIAPVDGKGPLEVLEDYTITEDLIVYQLLTSARHRNLNEIERQIFQGQVNELVKARDREWAQRERDRDLWKKQKAEENQAYSADIQKNAKGKSSLPAGACPVCRGSGSVTSADAMNKGYNSNYSGKVGGRYTAGSGGVSYTTSTCSACAGSGHQ